MILHIDVGNTCVKWRLMDASELVVVKPVKVELLGIFLENLQGRFNDLTLIKISSVVSSMELERRCAVYYPYVGVVVVEVRQNHLGLRCAYKDVSKLGVDRWLALFSVYKKYLENVVVVDVGTAMTIDILSVRGTHEGGYILPGLTSSVNALSSSTKKLPVLGRFGLEVSPGTNTDDAISAGVLIQMVGAVEMVHRKYPSHGLVVSGGDGALLCRHLKKAEYWPDIVLDGLLYIDEHE
jgi:type III pantothenate kinase